MDESKKNESLCELLLLVDTENWNDDYNVLAGRVLVKNRITDEIAKAALSDPGILTTFTALCGNELKCTKQQRKMRRKLFALAAATHTCLDIGALYPVYMKSLKWRHEMYDVRKTVSAECLLSDDIQNEANDLRKSTDRYRRFADGLVRFGLGGMYGISTPLDKKHSSPIMTSLAVTAKYIYDIENVVDGKIDSLTKEDAIVIAETVCSTMNSSLKLPRQTKFLDQIELPFEAVTLILDVLADGVRTQPVCNALQYFELIDKLVNFMKILYSKQVVAEMEKEGGWPLMRKVTVLPLRYQWTNEWCCKRREEREDDLDKSDED